MVFVQDGNDFQKALKQVFIQLIVSLLSQNLHFYSNRSDTTGQTPHATATPGSKKEKMHH